MAVDPHVLEKHLESLEQAVTRAVDDEKASGKQAQCEMCKSEASAEAFCKQCDKYACENCVHMHTVMTALFEGHELIPIDQIQKSKAEKPKQNITKRCEVHGELLKIFCFKCNKLICGDCIVKDHKDHKIEFNNVAAENKKKELMKSLKPLREVEERLSRAMEEVRNTECGVEGQGDSVANTIEASFEELHTILETRKQQLLGDVRRRVREKIEKLKGQEESLSIASAGVRSVIDYTEQCVTHCSDEVMSMHTEISRRIQEEVEKQGKAGNRLEPVEEADMGVEVRCAKDLQRLCQKAKITHIADVTVVKDMPSTAEVNKEINIEVVNTNKKAIENSLQCQIKCVRTGLVIKPEIKVKSPDMYEIFYTPGVRGRHEVSIRAYGQPIPGSPFTMTVYMSPAQLDKPVKVWYGVRCPFNIAVNSVGEIFVVELDSAIVVLDKEGKIRRHIKQSQHKIKGLQSISLDNEDNIYFIGEGCNKIGKANKNCDILLVRRMQVKQVKGTGYYDIAVVKDEVMVTEWGNDGYIMVYDKELDFVRQITTRNKTLLKYLHPDHCGNLYVVDNDCTIQVLSKTGDFIRSFGHDHNDVQLLKTPMFVHVCGQYVYVADAHLDKTLVFTTAGDYVTSLDTCGCVCVDQNGFLYIVDLVRDKVVCY